MDQSGGNTSPGERTRRFPRVPNYAWSWLQRSRPVVAEAARRLTGSPPGPGFVEELRVAFEDDPFTRDVVVGVVHDVAFGGRPPSRRPPRMSWDRGLTWWAAALAGVTPAEFEARSSARLAGQRQLFDPDPSAGGGDGGDAGTPGRHAGAPGGHVAGGRDAPAAGVEAIRRGARARVAADGPRSSERAALAMALRELLAAGDGDQVPASAIRQLIDHLESTA